MKYELMSERRGDMIVLDVHLDNLYAFKDFHLNLTYPKKIVGSCIEDEHLDGRPNFRYKKVNVIMGSNASGKTTLGRALMKIFNFIDKKDLDYITDMISDRSKVASFTLDMASKHNVFYRISCSIAPCVDEICVEDNISLKIQEEPIRAKDSYESCVKRVESKPYIPAENYFNELQKMATLDWLFVYPEETDRILRFPKNEEHFRDILENLLKALDPSILAVENSNDVEHTYVVRYKNRAEILQDGTIFKPTMLSSGTKAGVEIAQIISSMKHDHCSFYYCDEKFPYIHSDLEKAVISLMIESLHPNDQLFFTTHNTNVLDMSLPKHSFTFLRKNADDPERPITCVNASTLLKRSTDSLKNAVENDLFSCAPAVDRIYAIADI